MKAQLLLAIALLALGCSGAARNAPTRAEVALQATEIELPPLGEGDRVLLAVGDIARCARPAGPRETAALMKRLDGAIATLGDASNDDGSLEQYRRCFASSWGSLVGRIRPTPGNHDYYTPRAEGFFEFWGEAAGASGYYAYDLGSWRVISLNSNCAEVGGCGAGSAQLRWLKRELQESPRRCTVAYWHHPRFSSGPRGVNEGVEPLWQALYAAGAELVLNGHEHHYERFGALAPSGLPDPARGIRQFIVGTGGAGLRSLGRPEAGSEMRLNRSNGVLRLVLRADGYAWQFISVEGKVLDAGDSTCH